MTNPNKEQIDSIIFLYNNGQFQEALDALNLLNIEHPNVPLIFNLLGVCYKSLGRINNALDAFETASTLKPDYAEAFYNQGVMLQELDMLEKAIDCYKKTIEIIPKNPGAYNNLGIAHRSLGEIDKAIDSFEWAVAYKRDFAEAHNNLGACFQDNDKFDRAIDCYNNAINFKPDFAQAHNNLGIVHQKLGQIDESIKSYERALRIEPRFASAHHNLSLIKNFNNSDPQIKQMLDLLESDNLNQESKIYLNFSLAKAYEDLGISDKMFKYLDEGNLLRRQELNFSFEISHNGHQSIKNLFKSTKSIIKTSAKNDIDSNPIFIVGMPRSGSTLVEQIISSHYDVLGLGELSNFSRIIAHLSQEKTFLDKNTLTNDQILSVRKKYIKSINFNEKSKKYFTDKWPLNFRNIGFIFSAFPEAKIINTKRTAIATCWSIYKHYFSDQGNGWAYKQEDISKFYKLYEDFMEFWHKKYPNKIYDLSYEELTINQEEETRKLLNYCELDWDENCLNFHDNKRAVKTASSLQVRKKIYQGSSEAWREYEDYLQPLIKGLN